MHKIWSQCLVWQRITGESTGETQPNLLSKSHSTQLPIQDKRAKSSGFDTEVLVFLSTRDLLRGKLFKSETQETNTASDEWIAALKSAKQEERHQQAQKPSGREGWEGENEHLKLKCKKKKLKNLYDIKLSRQQRLDWDRSRSRSWQTGVPGKHSLTWSWKILFPQSLFFTIVSIYQMTSD